MLTVIFGAGASFDSIPLSPPKVGKDREESIEQIRPPLADDLFGGRVPFVEAISRFERLQPIVPLLRNTRGATVESVLERLRGEAAKDAERFRQLAAVRYYLQYMLRECEREWSGAAKGVTNYKTLLDDIRHWRQPTETVYLATFNYDTLLENSLPRSIGLTLDKINDYIEGSQYYKIIKLHGSVNWGREVDTKIAYVNPNYAWGVVQEHIERAENLNISTRYVIDPGLPMGAKGDVGLFPAIAIPVETKKEFECPTDHLEAFCQHLKITDRLLLIGWRATDAHFVKLLAENVPDSPTALVVVGSENEAVKIVRRLGDAFSASKKNIHCEITTGGFTDLILSNEAQRILAV